MEMEKQKFYAICNKKTPHGDKWFDYQYRYVNPYVKENIYSVKLPIIKTKISVTSHIEKVYG